MTKLAKNTSSGPVVIDDDGHTLGGGEWGQVDTDAARVTDAVDAGLLVVNDDGPADDKPPVHHRAAKAEEKS